MPLQTTDDILDAVERLPVGSTLVIPQVSWDDYERLLDALEERPCFRVCYDRGTLEIMSPGRKHGISEQLIDDLVLIACEMLHLKLEKCGNTTRKRRLLARGIEADGSYYIQNESEAILDVEADIESLPPFPRCGSTTGVLAGFIGCPRANTQRSPSAPLFPD